MLEENKTRLQELAEKWLNGSLAQSELEEFNRWFNATDAEPLPVEKSRMEYRDYLFKRIKEETGVLQPKRVRLWPKVAVTAAVLITVFGAGLFLIKSQSLKDKQAPAFANDIAPGKHGATLTLANGTQIRLSDASNGEIARQAGIVITKSANGQLVYEIKNPETETNRINTLSTAKGETYQLRLPDGSLVWLNAASSLTYSANLNQRGKRRVKLEGEGYFEIAKDKAHPFVVESKYQEVEVLGTHFNMSTYPEEVDVKTTLLEGSIKILAGSQQSVLKPGQQALLTSSGIKVKNVDAEDAIAWKDGLFVFDDEPLSSIMKKIERWYNVEVIYSKNVNQNELYGGSVSRYDQISAVLKTLELTKNIHFKIEGRRLIVMR